MNKQIFKDAMAEISAVFGGYEKKANVLDVWFDRVQHIPDEAVSYITERLCDMENMPRNMVLAWKHAWADWKAANPSRMVRPDCHACRNSGVMHGWARQESDAWMTFGIPCPACQHDDSREPVSLREFEAKGCVIMPVDYPGGAVAFDRDNGFGCLWPVGLDTSTPRPQMRAGVDTKQDFSRVRHLPPAEREDYAQTANW